MFFCHIFLLINYLTISNLVPQVHVESNPRFVASEGKTFKIDGKGEFKELGDFQVKIVGEISNAKLSKFHADKSKGWQWLCNCTCLLSGNLVTR